jgi:manganese oxidase
MRNTRLPPESTIPESDIPPSPIPESKSSMNRRNFFNSAAISAVAAASVSKVAMAALPEPVIMTKPDTAPPLIPNTGQPYNPVVTLNGWTLPWRMNNGVKEFHLVAEPVVREMSPGFKVNMWGYNGQSPGPTIEVVEGDRIRLFVTNKLPEHTTVHWHGQRLPNGMDGVGGMNQKQIPVGKTFVYEFIARRPGTFMYHPHADEMTQMAMGMMGFWVTHPKGKHPLIDEVQRDFCFLLNGYDVDPGSMTPKVNTCWTSTSGAGTAASSPASNRSTCDSMTRCASAWVT